MAAENQRASRGVCWPWQGWVGLLLLAVFWPLNWLLPGVRTAYLFFPLWLGYILAVDALVWRRVGSSLLSRSPKSFALLFVVSAPAWWLFEVINRRTGNWEYMGAERFSALAYVVLCTVSFSTVMPAVFETAEWVGSWRWTQRWARGPRIPSTPGVHRFYFLAGIGMLAVTLLWPTYCYPLVWCAVVFILEPVNIWLGRAHLLERVAEGDWRLALSLSLGTLICGFFWEMWNYYAYPRWIYHTPGVEFLHIFEMPLLGYGGYLFFAWEVYELRSLVWPGAPPLKI